MPSVTIIKLADKPKASHMENSNSSENLHRPEDISVMLNSASDQCCGRAFSWKRAARVLGCVFSVLWLVMLHVGTANSGGFGHVSIRGKAIITIGSIAAVFPMLFLRGRVIYVLGLPFLLAVVWTFWVCWKSWGWL